ncbi:aspartate-semialdehyde dehydrogenase [Aeropyrum camini]|uniref:Aspartate-semialdehyde dehydrogenase n=1 Tax=Aeropyrum camini SY1 = JCM 12091 TaxID=1198449 RepID=U3TE20_9CREN|nr:aspartate-semialdehyde dehydrogenase [Aeropyrum camini]BAN90198.1 aspartate-semialdehyde dehydrogenase [Aeropyrum camini SY1 = JCM 12091]
MGDRVRAAVLGASGLVGQVFLRLLEGHPYFEVAAVASSPGKAGLEAVEAIDWILPGGPPGYLEGMSMSRPEPGALRREGVELVFSALPSQAAAELEPALAREGLEVFSNSSNMRLYPDVPLVNGEVNPGHLALAEAQGERGWRGVVVKNPNCTTAILTLALKPIMDAAGLREVHVATMQAISGAGRRGVPGYGIVDNIVPHIPGEEGKVEAESRKILGSLRGGRLEPAGFSVAATTTRVPVLEGHLEVVYLKTRRHLGAEEAVEVLESFRGIPQELGLPTAPTRPVRVLRREDRPQPRLDRMAGGGMTVSVGRVEEKEGGWLRMVVLGHNLVRGAAGAALLAAELWLRRGEWM